MRQAAHSLTAGDPPGTTTPCGRVHPGYDRLKYTFPLNAEYEIRNEIAELWMRGYGTLATRLSKLHSSNNLPRQPATGYLSWHALQIPYMYRQWSVIS